MAKSKTDQDNLDLEFQPSTSDWKQEAEPAGEKDALKAEIARLKAENEKLLSQQGQMMVQAAAQPGPIVAELRFWRVTIPFGAVRIVKAADPLHAFEVYKQTMGIINTEHMPDVTLVDLAAWEEEQEKLRRSGQAR